jgi:single-strand DNA-binding protein
MTNYAQKPSFQSIVLSEKVGSIPMIAGRLGRDPELRYTGEGKAVVNISIAQDYFAMGQKCTIWWPVCAFGRNAELINEYLAKGDMVLFTGRDFLPEPFVGKEGNEIHLRKFLVHSMQFLNKAKANQVAPPVNQQTMAAGAADDYHADGPTEDDIPF